MGKTETPGGFEAFSAEEKQAFYELMTNIESDAEVLIERHDDVSVRRGSEVQLIQVKSATSEDNQPLGNRTKDLWKTLSNWIDKIRELDKKGEFHVCACRYSVSSVHDLRIDSIVSCFQQAYSVKDAERALEQIRADFNDPPDGLKAYYDNFFALENRDIAIRIVRCFKYEIHRGFEAELQDLFYRTCSVSPELKPKLFNMVCGWIRQEAAKHTEKGEPAVLRRADYWKEVEASSMLRRENPLIVDIEPPSSSEIKQEKSQMPTYLRQLGLIGMSVEDLDCNEGLRAIREKLRSDSLVAELAKEGAISDKSFKQYRDDLVSDWDDVRYEKLLEGSSSAVTLGCRIYYETRKMARANKIQGYEPPRYFSNGQLHTLADETESDNEVPRIGWHPRYEDELKRMGEGGVIENEGKSIS